ncbi:MAG: hypothetical protein ACOCUB_02420 [Desulfohalobiaceae bacterium]
MQNLGLFSRSLEKSRAHPLNVHCRQLLRQAGQTPSPAALGAPELMEWSLEQEKLDLTQDTRDRLRELVQLMLGKPSMSLGFLDYLQPDENSPELQALLAEEAPLSLGKKLLQRLEEQLQHYSEQQE